ncbi:MAG: DUF3307 domain-containing protein [Elusimicrobiota bacterium]|jgi:hypothetical protein
MDIFWRLVLAHFISDFTLQTNKVASSKRKNYGGMLIHILTHPVVMTILVWPYLSWPWVQTRWFRLDGWVCVGLLTLFHWLEDEWRIWSIQEAGSPDNTGFMLWDQVVHVTMILAFSPATPVVPTQPWILPVLCGVLLSHFLSVLIFFLENDLWGDSRILVEWKYQDIGERLVAVGLLLLPGAWFLLAFPWMGSLVYVHYYRQKQWTWVHVLLGNLAVVLLGLLVRGVLS